MEEPATDEPRAAEAGRLVCPFLVSAAGPWRSAEPARDHRCSRLTHATHLDLVHQRRFCLGSGGPGCPHYVAARAPGRFVSTLPVVVDRGPMTVTLERDGIRRLAAPAIVVIVGAALGALLLSRGPGAPGPPPGGSAGAALGTSTPSSTASSSPGSPVPSQTPVPSASPIPSSTPGPSASPTTTSGRTYTVRPGDTLGAIAAKFGTTTRVLVQLNAIANPSLIHAGEVLKLP
jgi:nucleoid-associated protein YgaU